jgi:hypothetical protein
MIRYRGKAFNWYCKMQNMLQVSLEVSIWRNIFFSNIKTARPWQWTWLSPQMWTETDKQPLLKSIYLNSWQTDRVNLK